MSVPFRSVEAKSCDPVAEGLKLALDVAIDLRRKEFSAAEVLPPSGGEAGELNLHDLPFVRSRIAEVSGALLSIGTSVSLPCDRRDFEDDKGRAEALLERYQDLAKKDGPASAHPDVIDWARLAVGDLKPALNASRLVRRYGDPFEGLVVGIAGGAGPFDIPAPAGPRPPICDAAGGRAPEEPASVGAGRALDAALALRRTGSGESAADLLRIAFHLVEFVELVETKGPDPVGEGSAAADRPWDGPEAKAAAIRDLDRIGRWLRAPIGPAGERDATRLATLFRSLADAYQRLGADRSRQVEASVLLMCRASEFVEATVGSTKARWILSDLAAVLNRAVDVPPELRAWAVGWALHGYSAYDEALHEWLRRNDDVDSGDTLNLVSDVAFLIGPFAPPVIAGRNAELFAWVPARAHRVPITPRWRDAPFGRSEVIQNIVMSLHTRVFDAGDVELLPYLDTAFATWRIALAAEDRETEDTAAYARALPDLVAAARDDRRSGERGAPSNGEPYTANPRLRRGG